MKTQQSLFVSEALTSLFHGTPEQFLALLTRDGTKFLRFYWDQVGKPLPEERRSPDFGLNYDIRKPEARVWVALITLPTPREPGEAHMVALIYRPDRVTPFLRVADVTKVVSLEYQNDDAGQPVTVLVEWDRKLNREELGPGPRAVLDDFFQAVMGMI